MQKLKSVVGPFSIKTGDVKLFSFLYVHRVCNFDCEIQIITNAYDPIQFQPATLSAEYCGIVTISSVISTLCRSILAQMAEITVYNRSKAVCLCVC